MKIGNKKLSILLYADDIVLLSDTENGLQAMLNVVHKWGQTFMIKFNEKKSTILTQNYTTVGSVQFWTIVVTFGVLNSLNKLKPFNTRQFVFFYECKDMHLYQKLMGILVGHLVTLEGKLQCLDIGID